MNAELMASMRYTRRNQRTAWKPRHTPLVADFAADYRPDPWPVMSEVAWAAMLPPF